MAYAQLNAEPCNRFAEMENWAALPQILQQMQDDIAAVSGGEFPYQMAVGWLGDIGDIPAGWAVCDSVANAVGLGGSGRDLIDVFVKFGTVPDDFVAAANTGNASPAVTISGSTGSASPGGSCSGTTGSSSGTTGSASPTGSVSGTIGAASTGISVGDHAGLSTNGVYVTSSSAHIHQVQPNTQVQSGTGGWAFSSNSANTTSTDVNSHFHDISSFGHSVTDPTHTHSMSSVSVTLSSHDHSIGSHTHGFSGSISVDGHPHGTGTLAGATAAHDHTPGAPAHCVIIPIERLNPP